MDARNNACIGGTGTTIPESLVEDCAKKVKLWLAGGINCDNVASINSAFTPELIDASSGLEEVKGKKSMELLDKFFALVR